MTGNGTLPIGTSSLESFKITSLEKNLLDNLKTSKQKMVKEISTKIIHTILKENVSDGEIFH
jgi:hypothetical protein